MYESDEDKPIISRIMRSLCSVIILGVVVTIFSLIAYFGMKNIDYAAVESVNYTSFVTSEATISKI